MLGEHEEELDPGHPVDGGKGDRRERKRNQLQQNSGS
jgi:hypothetical protein